MLLSYGFPSPNENYAKNLLVDLSFSRVCRHLPFVGVRSRNGRDLPSLSL